MKLILFTARWAIIGLFAAAAVVLVAKSGAVSSRISLWWSGLDQPGYADAVSRAAPAVVSIHAFGRTEIAPNPLTADPLFQQFFGAESAPPTEQANTNLGSGVILDASGVILTNFHVVREAESISVTLLDGRSATATVVGSDPDTDLAVLRLNLDQLPSIPLGDSDTLRVGDIVLAIGNPLGIGQTVTQGIVSATGRNRVGINTFENFIQIDAAINFGNSGGALINHRGELVGINSVRLDSEGIGFAIPTSIALAIARELLAHGTVERGWLGIDARDLSSSLKAMLEVEQGILVLGTLAGGPAHQAGVVNGDVLTRLGNYPIIDSRTAIERIASFKPGTEIALHGVRNGKPYVTSLTVSRRPPASP